MYSISTRVNSVFFFFVVCLLLLSAFNILTTIFQKSTPTVNKFDFKKFTSLYYHPYTRVQHGLGVFDMDIDFTPCFNWNSNLVFAWISAKYKAGPKSSEVMVTVWDNIMLRKDEQSHKVQFDRKMFEYPIVDTFRTLAGKEVILELNWEHMPVVGPILKHKIELGTYQLPEQITQNPAKSILYREIHYDDEDEY